MFKIALGFVGAVAFGLLSFCSQAQEATSVVSSNDLEANKHLVEQVVSVLSTGEYDLLDEIVAEDYIQNGVGRPSTREGLRLTYTAYRAAFPDIQWTIDQIGAEGDLVFIHTTLTGTHQGEFNGIPATGNEVTLCTMDIYRIENGLIVEHWDVYDQYALLQQLGMIPSPK